MSRRTEFADDEGVQRRAQRRGHLIGHREPAAGQAEHDHIGLVAVGRQQPGQNLSGLLAVFEHPARVLSANTGGAGHGRPPPVGPRDWSTSASGRRGVAGG